MTNYCRDWESHINVRTREHCALFVNMCSTSLNVTRYPAEPEKAGISEHFQFKNIKHSVSYKGENLQTNQMSIVRGLVKYCVV